MHCICLLLLFITSLSITAKESVVVALTHIPKVLEFENKHAPYNKLITQIESELTVSVRYDFMPSERGNRLLERAKIDCIFPIIPADYKRRDKTAFSAPINGISLNLFALDRKYQGLAELEGKIVVHLRGYLFANAKDKFPTIKFFPASSHENAINMLKNGRATAYLDYMPDVRFSIPTEQMQRLKFDESSPVLRANDSFECKDFGEPKRFLQEVEKAILRLREEGRLKRILGDYYVPILN